jgi:hypothetical protein
MAIIIVVLLASGTILAQLSSFKLIGSRGTVTVVGVGAYWDPNCISSVSSMDWGTIELGTVKDKIIFIRNEGNAPSTLFLATNNWNPINASKFITLTWDYDDSIISSQQVIKVTLTLSSSSNTEGIQDFTFDILIGVNQIS